MRLVAGRNEQLIHGEKEPSMPSARRSGYRGSLKGDAAIRAEVGGESGPAFGDVLDLSLKGTAVQISLDQDPAFVIGETVTLTLRFERGRSVQVEASLRARTDLDGFRCFNFAFLNPSALRAKLPAALLWSFNERDAFRVEPEGLVPVNLQIVGTGSLTSGRMRDVSVDGFSVLLDDGAAKQLSPGVHVSAEFTLPGHDGPVTFHASIRSRSTLAGSVLIGLRFDRDPSSAFVSQRRTVIDYVMTRQRDWLQARVET